MLPIVSNDVQAARVSIYRESTQKKHPLLGLRLKNTSGAHLMQGPITVFEGSSYAGDAVVEDLQPNEERLLSYAIDLGTEVNAVPSSDSGRVLAIKAVKGVIQTTVKNRQIRTYTIKNRNDAERTVLVEHPVNHTFRLVSEQKPIETASDFYRFELKVPAGKDKTLVVAEEREDQNVYVISNQSDEMVRFLISQPLATKELKEGLQRAVALKLAHSKTQADLGEAKRQLGEITKDQERIRANLQATPSDSEPHKLYLKKLLEQEKELEKYQREIKQLQEAEHKQKKELDDFIAGFTVS
jgi:hypothetical protein